jgi:hypothetical protein
VRSHASASSLICSASECLRAATAPNRREAKACIVLHQACRVFVIVVDGQQLGARAAERARVREGDGAEQQRQAEGGLRSRPQRAAQPAVVHAHAVEVQDAKRRRRREALRVGGAA